MRVVCLWLVSVITVVKENIIIFSCELELNILNVGEILKKLKKINGYVNDKHLRKKNYLLFLSISSL